ncbi:MAG: hypothetical protein ACOCXQ_02980 [Patescibacteria group bacterium]
MSETTVCTPPEVNTTYTTIEGVSVVGGHPLEVVEDSTLKRRRMQRLSCGPTEAVTSPKQSGAMEDAVCMQVAEDRILFALIDTSRGCTGAESMAERTVRYLAKQPAGTPFTKEVLRKTTPQGPGEKPEQDGSLSTYSPLVVEVTPGKLEMTGKGSNDVLVVKEIETNPKLMLYQPHQRSGISYNRLHIAASNAHGRHVPLSSADTAFCFSDGIDQAYLVGRVQELIRRGIRGTELTKQLLDEITNNCKTERWQNGQPLLDDVSIVAIPGMGESQKMVSEEYVLS